MTADTRPRLLLLIPSTSYRVKDFMNAAERRGAEITVGSDQESVLQELSDTAALTLNFRDVDGSTAVIQAFHRGHPLSAVLAVDEVTTRLAAAASKALGLTHNPTDAVAKTGNKRAFREAVQAAGLPVPWFTTIRLGDDPEAAAAGQDYPCVLKPLSLSASRGVIRANDPTEFVAAFQRIAAMIPVGTAKEDQHILVEEYLPGDEVALEGLLINGKLSLLALFDKPDPLEDPYFEETIYVTPSRHPADLQDAICRTAEQTCAALGLTDGPVHAELRIRAPERPSNQQGPWVIELAARTIGGLCSRSLSFDGGYSLEEIIIDQALGRTLEPPARESTASGVMMIPIPRAGILKSFSGELEARNVPGITGLEISILRGQEVVPLPEGDRYLGFIFAKAEKPEEAEAALRLAHQKLSFEID